LVYIGLINPRNPDSNQWLQVHNLLRRMREVLVFWGISPENNFESGFTGLGSPTVFVPACLQTAHLIP
jgi:hypothetical protein